MVDEIQSVGSNVAAHLPDQLRAALAASPAAPARRRPPAVPARLPPPDVAPSCPLAGGHVVLAEHSRLWVGSMRLEVSRSVPSLGGHASTGSPLPRRRSASPVSPVPDRWRRPASPPPGADAGAGTLEPIGNGEARVLIRTMPTRMVSHRGQGAAAMSQEEERRTMAVQAMPMRRMSNAGSAVSFGGSEIVANA